MKIAIRFSDNDFYNCFHGVLETIKNGNNWTDDFISDKEKLCVIINEISYGMYLLYQNRFKYGEEVDGTVCERLKKYLKITPEDILINDEVDKHIKDNIEFGDNGETFIYDTNLDYENNDPIYTF